MRMIQTQIQSGKGKKYAKAGNRNEKPLLQALLKSSENPHKVLQIMRPGLVSKHGYSYIKTSVKAIGFIKIEDGDLEIDKRDRLRQFHGSFENLEMYG